MITLVLPPSAQPHCANYCSEMKAHPPQTLPSLSSLFLASNNIRVSEAACRRTGFTLLLPVGKVIETPGFPFELQVYDVILPLLRALCTGTFSQTCLLRIL